MKPTTSKDCLSLAKNEVSNTEVMKLLLESGTELTSDILNKAVKSEGCQLETVKFLLECGATMDLWVLEDAAENKGGNVAIIKLLLDHGAEHRRCILHEVVKFKDCKCEVIELFLEYGAELTPGVLNSAVRSEGCKYEVIQLLLEKGSKINYPVLLDACKGGNLKVIKLLLDRGAPCDYFHLKNATLNGASIEVIKFLLANAINLPYWIFYDILREDRCSAKVIHLLLECGARVTGFALKQALIYKGHDINIIKIILEKISYLDSDVLKAAISNSKCTTQVVQLLLESGVKPNMSIIKYAVQNEYYEMEKIKLLLESGLKLSNDIFQCYRINSSNIKISKSLLQFSLLQWFNMCVHEKSLQYETVFKISNFEHKTLYKEMSVFFDGLKKDMKEMKSDEIDQDSTVFSFISDRCSSEKVKQDRQYSLVDKVLSKFGSGRYIFCHDLLHASLSRNELLYKIYELDIYVIKNLSGKPFCGEKVSLNPHVAVHLASFLNKYDLISLMLAFRHE